jgi:hypothetical protein
LLLDGKLVVLHELLMGRYLAHIALRFINSTTSRYLLLLLVRVLLLLLLLQLMAMLLAHLAWGCLLLLRVHLGSWHGVVTGLLLLGVGYIECAGSASILVGQCAVF